MISFSTQKNGLGTIKLLAEKLILIISILTATSTNCQKDSKGRARTGWLVRFVFLFVSIGAMPKHSVRAPARGYAVPWERVKPIFWAVWWCVSEWVVQRVHVGGEVCLSLWQQTQHHNVLGRRCGGIHNVGVGRSWAFCWMPLIWWSLCRSLRHERQCRGVGQQLRWEQRGGRLLDSGRELPAQRAWATLRDGEKSALA